MKKSILMLLFVVISFVSNSQSGIYVSIDNQPKVEMLEFNSFFATESKNVLVTQNASSIIKIDFDNMLLTNPTFSANYSLWIGKRYSVIMTSTNGGLITTGLIQNSGNTFTFNAVSTTFTAGNEQMYLKFEDSTNSVSQQVPVRFHIDHKTNPFNTVLSQTGNTVNVNFVKYTYTNTVLNNNSFEYVFNSSITAPTTSLSGSTINNLSYNVTQSDSGAIKYFHIRSTDTIISKWYTYSVQLQYTAPTTTTTVSIAEIENVTDFKLYPNPVKDVITIEYSSKNNIDHVSLYTITGQEVSTTAVESMGNNTLTFNVESYPAGIYFVRIGTASYKFIKQ